MYEEQGQHIPECFYRVSAKALILNQEGKFLLCKEDNDMWEIPGGGLDHGETPQEGITREVMEEMGLTVTWVAENPSYFLTIPTKNKQCFIANVVFETRVEDLNITPSNECVEIGFFSPEDLEGMQCYQNVRELGRMFG